MCNSRFSQSPNKKSTDLTVQRTETHVPITKEYATCKSHFFLTKTTTTATFFFYSIVVEEKEMRKTTKYREQNNGTFIVIYLQVCELVRSSQSSKAFELAVAYSQITKGTKETNNNY